MNHITRTFICEEHQEYSGKGWRPEWIPGADPLEGMGAAHDAEGACSRRICFFSTALDCHACLSVSFALTSCALHCIRLHVFA